MMAGDLKRARTAKTIQRAQDDGALAACPSARDAEEDVEPGGHGGELVGDAVVHAAAVHEEVRCEGVEADADDVVDHGEADEEQGEARCRLFRRRVLTVGLVGHGLDEAVDLPARKGVDLARWTRDDARVDACDDGRAMTATVGDRRRRRRGKEPAQDDTCTLLSRHTATTAAAALRHTRGKRRRRRASCRDSPPPFSRQGTRRPALLPARFRGGSNVHRRRSPRHAPRAALPLLARRACGREPAN